MIITITVSLCKEQYLYLPRAHSQWFPVSARRIREGGLDHPCDVSSANTVDDASPTCKLDSKFEHCDPVNDRGLGFAGAVWGVIVLLWANEEPGVLPSGLNSTCQGEGPGEPCIPHKSLSRQMC